MKTFPSDFLCPFLGITFNNYPAVSRKSNKTAICSDCAVAQRLKTTRVDSVNTRNTEICEMSRLMKGVSRVKHGESDEEL